MNRDAIEPVLDMDRALEFLGNDGLLLQEVAQAYAAGAPQWYGALGRAIAARDPRAGLRILHRLLPTVRLIGSAQLVREGERLQDAWQAGLGDYEAKGFLRCLRQFNRELAGVPSHGAWRSHDSTQPRH